MKFRPMPVLTVLTAISLAVLMQLGSWQYGRYTEKKYQTSTREIPVSGSEMLNLKVLQDHSGQIQQVNGMADGEFIWRRYVPARLSGSGEIVLALLDATGGITQSHAAIATAPEELIYEGRLIAKQAQRQWFGQDNRPASDTWYRLDARQIANHLNLPQIERVAEPVNLTITNSENVLQQRVTRNPYAAKTPIDPLPPERHFGYALTWWGMALGLFGVYMALHHTHGRLRLRKR